MENVFTVDGVVLNRRGSYILGTLILSRFHLVFTFNSPRTASAISSTLDASQQRKEIWVCYPIIERISKARGSTWLNNNFDNSSNGYGSGSSNNIDSKPSNSSGSHSRANSPALQIAGFDNYSASHIRLQCKDFTYFSFDFRNDLICCEVFNKMSLLITKSKIENDIRQLYAYSYVPNNIEQNLQVKGWDLYDPIEEYTRLGLLRRDGHNNKLFWKLTNINENYKFCTSYPKVMIVPSSISDNVLQHAGKFRSKQRIPVVVYKHHANINGNVIARCAQPLVGLNLQNRSIQDEKLIGEIFHSQELEKAFMLKSCEEEILNDNDTGYQAQQPQKNLLVDLRPVTNAMAQHALGAGTENVENYRNKKPHKDDDHYNGDGHQQGHRNSRQVDKIFCNIDNIHVIRDSLNKLTTVLNNLDKYSPNSQVNVSNSSTATTPTTTTTPITTTTPTTTTTTTTTTASASLQQALSKTYWLHRLSIILQSVDRIIKSIHLNNTNVVIHCSDGWDRTSQVSALAQLCLDPFYRTTKGFMILIEKEWTSFGFKYRTRADHGGCIGAVMKKEQKKYIAQPNGNESPQSQQQQQPAESVSSESMTMLENRPLSELSSSAAASVTSFFQKAAKAARDLKNSAQNGLSNYPDEGTDYPNDSLINKSSISFSSTTYGGSNERSPVFHQFIDCIYQIHRQKPTYFEFNTRFLKRLLYHYYSCQYGTFLCDSEKEAQQVYRIDKSTVSVWDYFNSRPNEFKNPAYTVRERGKAEVMAETKANTNTNAKAKVKKDDDDCGGVVFFNSADMKWWSELYGRSDEEMNGLSNSLDRKFAQMDLK
ncbi:YMR1 [Candida oxycetoniae]|uniref:YMR1 n=1 Tax=Candida oxycetoniae TaxID=497107 RepID=A0AAI9SYS5_9ASCO|nr:YMR1 [Candida oxycetoniae]KAI3405269.2 YMR1 [Candida oxycetoniae]